LQNLWVKSDSLLICGDKVKICGFYVIICGVFLFVGFLGYQPHKSYICG
jgi:hypothetical protein